MKPQSSESTPDTPKGLSLPKRRLIACVGIIVFLFTYVAVVSDIGRHLPNLLWAQLLFYGLAGILWGVPILPLISWSEGYKSKRKR